MQAFFYFYKCSGDFCNASFVTIAVCFVKRYRV